MPEKNIVSKVPELTPELLAANAEQQKTWRAQFVLPDSSTEAYAASVIASNLEMLDALEIAVDKADGEEYKQIRVKLIALREETATWLGTIGKFTDAKRVAYSQRQKGLYRQYEKAVARDDADWCKHPRWAEKDGQFEQIAYREFDFPSTKHGGIVSMMRCSICDFRNGATLSADLEKLSAARAKILADTTGMTREQTTENLKSENFHTEGLRKVLR